jgi:amino acid adenylation domain-containing protein
MVLLAAYQVLLYRFSGQHDILLGTPIRGRTAPQSEDLIGFFVNTLVLRTRLNPDASFAELLQRVRSVYLDAFNQPDMPFELLVQRLGIQRDLSRSPVYQAFFSYQDATRREPKIGDVPFSQMHIHSSAAPTDVFLWVKVSRDRLHGGLIYSTDLFDAETMQRMARAYRFLLAQVARNPQQTVARIPILPKRERALLREWNRMERDYPRAARIQDLIEAQVERSPDAIAATFEASSITYRDLNTRANQLAHRLRRMGIGRGALVGVLIERSIEMLVGVLGILKTGATYVPLDPAYPTDRLSFMVDDARISGLVTEEKLAQRLSFQSAAVVKIDADRRAIDSEPAQNLGASTDGMEATSESVAYVIYTSGSTGRPKGVQVPHRAVVNFLCSVAKEPGLGPGDSILGISSISFDLSVVDLFLPLSVGGRLVIASREVISDAARVVALLRRERITALQSTPSTWRWLLDAGWTGGDNLKVICSGEKLPRELAEQLAQRAGSLWTMYGPTETTVWSTGTRLPQPMRSPVTMGRPIANTQIHILDAYQQPVPIGVPGEIYIGGDGVAHGYLGRPELNAERFIADPSAPSNGKLYRSGDFGRYRPDGRIESLGRNDAQVKVRGFRVELGEIEAALSSHPSILHSAATVREERPGDVRLVAYVVPRPGEDYTDTELRRHLRKTLPEYMIPQHFAEIEALPLSPNGKLDRKALPAVFASPASAEEEYAPPSTSEEALIASVWQEVLGIDRISVHDNFFNIGGHSLSCIAAIAKLEAKTGRRLNPRVILLNSLQQIALQLAEMSARMPPRSTVED